MLGTVAYSKLNKFLDFNIQNLIRNGGFDSGTTGWTAFRGTIDVVDGKLRFTDNSNNTEHYATQAIQTPPVEGHKYYAKVELEHGGCMKLYCKRSDGAYREWQIKSSSIITIESVYATPEWFVRLYGRLGTYTGTGESYEFDNIMLIDLTEAFGAGNEPTLEEIEDIIAEQGGYWEGAFHPTHKTAFNWLLEKIEHSEVLYHPKYPDPAHIVPTYYSRDSNVVCDIAPNGDLIGYRFNRVKKSTDKGATWVDFSPTLPPLPVDGQYVKLMGDGHLLVFGLHVATNDGVILRSSNTTFDSTTTWVEIERIPTSSFATGNPYGMNVCENVVLCSTYPKRGGVLLSTDFGQTFEEILSLPSITHVHHSYFDPYDKSIWVAVGDGTIHRNLYYSTDWGVTWNTVWPPGSAPTQITSIIARPECVLFGTDVPEEYAVWRWDKERKEIKKVFEGGYDEGSTVASLGVMAFNQPTESGLITWMPFSAENATKRWRLLATPDGWNFYVINEPANPGTEYNLLAVRGISAGSLILSITGYTGVMNLPVWYAQ